MSKNRIFLLDYLKGITIFLVVWGHTIQFAPHSGFDFFQNKVFIFIYSFHMPLFMFISGYLFFYSTKKQTLTILKNKIRQLIIPIICCSFINCFVLFLISLRNKRGLSYNIICFLKNYIKSTPYELWFLWATFFCILIVLFCHKFFKDNIFAYFIVFIIILLTPDHMNSQMYKFMLPYFIIGYLFNIHKDKIKKYLKYMQSISFILFPMMLIFWNKNYYIYITRMSLFTQNISYRLIVILYRYTIGFVGIIFVITLIKLSLKYFKINFIANLGKYTLGIYILQNFTTRFFNLIPRINSNNMFLYNFIFTPIIATLFILISIVIIKLIQKNKYVNKLFLGGR